ncbi:hypothetical protein CHLRE_09g391319v5 [Chlamydomonas reinhardtii]|uniref:MYND-type domain-containing protein n=1 Tax=Chlamydomonas reinhardtii TaxID=3055 RepID=A0A2K3DE68_CHLRE|nr:uncharacterized protein CHLRE_09g391319v5 [Chlamydomonas reinhardtii]PNW78823.1 hypothetical protein CHLRE_09g391319v5 [Chlamydomonas reinhardtii]
MPTARSRASAATGGSGNSSANAQQPAAGPTSTQLINERAHILGLQLQAAALAARIQHAVASYGSPSLHQQLRELLQRGVLSADATAARSEVAYLQALLERVQSGRLASTSAAGGGGGGNGAASGGARQGGRRGGGAAAGASGAGGAGAASASAAAPLPLTARAAGSKQFSALAAEHVRHWLEQAGEAVGLLEDLCAPGSIEEWPLEPPEPPPPRPPGGPPVAHFIARIPAELASHMELPTTGYSQLQPPPAAAATAAAAGATAAAAADGGGVCVEAGTANGVGAGAGAGAACVSCGGSGLHSGGGAAASTSGGLLWAAAPLLHDPAAGVSYRVACHESWPEGTVLLRAAVRVLGLGLQASDVVIHNNEEDDVFVECAAGPPPPPPPAPLGAAAGGAAAAAAGTAAGSTAAGGGAAGGRIGAEAGGVVLENLTLLQLGGYEGALRVLRGRTTLVDVVVQFAMGGVTVEPGAHLVLGPGTRVAGGATAGVQVAAGGCAELLGPGCEVTRCGGGDDVVPKDLGGVELMVPLADYPRLPAAPSPKALLQAHRQLLDGSSSGSSAAAAAAAAGTTAIGCANDNGCSAANDGSSSGSGSSSAPVPPQDHLTSHLGALQPPATVVVGPGCTIHNTRGFAISIVKKRALAAYHELIHSGAAGGGGGGSAPGSSAGAFGAGAAAASGGAGGGGGGCSLAAALEGARVLVARGACLGPNNSRGAVGVVELEYHQLDGDAVNRRTASRHFHAVQLAARQLQEGFASPGVDWTTHRIRLEANPARPGRRATKLEIAATAAAAAAAAGGGAGGGRRRAGNGVVVGCRTLRQVLCASVARAQRRQRGIAHRRAGGGSSSSGDNGSSSSGDGSSSSGDDDDSQDESGDEYTSSSGGGSDGVCEDGSASASSSTRAAGAATADGTPMSMPGLFRGVSTEHSPAAIRAAVAAAAVSGSGLTVASPSRSLPVLPRVCCGCGRTASGAEGAAAAAAAAAVPVAAVAAAAGTADATGPGESSGDGAKPSSAAAVAGAQDGSVAAGAGTGTTLPPSPGQPQERPPPPPEQPGQTVPAAPGGGAPAAEGGPGAAAAASPQLGAAGTKPLRLRRCGACLSIYYCSADCQRRDWARHAPQCRALRGAAGGAGARGEVT